MPQFSRPTKYIIGLVIIILLSFNLVLAQEEPEEKSPVTSKTSSKRELPPPPPAQKKITGPTLYSTIRSLAKTERLSVVFDRNALAIAENTAVDSQLPELSSLSAITILLEANSLSYSQLDRRAILITSRISSYSNFAPLEEIIRKANKYEQVAQSARLAQKVFKLHNYSFTEAPLAVVINAIASEEKLNVIYEDVIAKLVETKKVNFSVKGVSSPRALTMLLASQRLLYLQVDDRTIMIRAEALANYKPSNSLENIITRAEQNEALGIE